MLENVSIEASMLSPPKLRQLCQQFTGQVSPFSCTTSVSKTVALKKITKWVFKTNYPLMQVKSIAECSKGSILQYFRPSLNFILSIFEWWFYTGFTVLIVTL